MRTLRFAFSIALVAAAAAAGAETAANPDGAVRAMVAKLVKAPEVVSGVIIERSDPFGGTPDRERGRVWYIPGRGLRYRSSQPGGQDVVIDRERGVFLVYSPSEKTLYRAPFQRAPARLRKMIQEPERVLASDFRAVADTRAVRGALRAGYRLRSMALGDSIPEVSTWIASGASGDLLRWIAFASQDDSVLIELQDLALRKSAKASDLVVSAPAGIHEEPLDPHELFEKGRSGESR